MRPETPLAVENGVKLYVLGPDLEARGMRKENVIDGIQVVDYGGFVDLTVEHQAVQAWL
jgi:tRNA 2-thiouridine synthesizing protein B